MHKMFYISTVFIVACIPIEAIANEVEKREMAIMSPESNSRTLNIQTKLDQVSQYMNLMNELYTDGPPAEMNQLLFLIGEWDTSFKAYDSAGKEFNNGNGKWRASFSKDKRMIIDEYDLLQSDGSVISSSTTLRTYSPVTKQWEMTNLYSMRPSKMATFTGKMVDHDFLATMNIPSPDGHATILKIRFFNITNDEFEWEQSASWDDGSTWTRMVLVRSNRSY